MALKGYQWIVEDELVAYFMFKRCDLTVLENAKDEDVNDFKDYLKEKGFEILEVIDKREKRG